MKRRKRSKPTRRQVALFFSTLRVPYIPIYFFLLYRYTCMSALSSGYCSLFGFSGVFEGRVISRLNDEGTSQPPILFATPTRFRVYLPIYNASIYIYISYLYMYIHISSFTRHTITRLFSIRKFVLCYHTCTLTCSLKKNNNRYVCICVFI